MSRVALVTGGTRGIGRGCSIALRDAGYSVAANYASNEERASAFAEETRIPVYKWDVGDLSACEDGIGRVEADLGPVEILVSNAAISPDRFMHKMPPETWRATIDRKVEAPRPVVAALAERLGLGGAGRIPPHGMGRDDGVGLALVNAVAQRHRELAFGHPDAARPDVGQALVVTTKPGAPFGLDRAGRCIREPLGERLRLAVGDELERVSRRGRGARIAVLIERHVGEAAIGGDGRRLPGGALERWHVGVRAALPRRRVGMGVALGLVHDVLLEWQKRSRPVKVPRRNPQIKSYSRRRRGQTGAEFFLSRVVEPSGHACSLRYRALSQAILTRLWASRETQ